MKVKGMRRCNPAFVKIMALAIGLPIVHAQEDRAANRQDGRHLYDTATFGGNGRTCVTCHGHKTGTVSPDDVMKRLQVDPLDPLMTFDGSDDGQGHGISRMMAHATILVEIPLPDNVSLADDLQARSVILRRGIPTTLNTPALDPVLMLDGRDADLQSQAMHAVQRHFQAAQDPTTEDISRIANFELTNRFFSSRALEKFAQGGPAPALPDGNTDAEKRGRRFFLNVSPFAPGADKAGACAVCHSGPLLNQTNQFNPLPIAPGTRFLTIGVSEGNLLSNPVREYIFRNSDGTQTSIRSADPGRALVTGKIDGNPGANGAPFFTSLNAFKIPILWGVKDTAPYFHDNSANTLEDVVNFYGDFVFPPFGITLTTEDRADIVAYLKLL